MRFLLPTLTERRKIYEELRHFFETHHTPSFNRAMGRLCKFYKVKKPKVHFYESLNYGKHLGETSERGTIAIIHPENWKKHRKHNSLQLFQNTCIHEVMHYLTWADNENRVRALTRKFEDGLEKAWSRKRW